MLYSVFLTNCIIFLLDQLHSFFDQLYSLPFWPVELCFFLNQLYSLFSWPVALCFLGQLYYLPSWPIELFFSWPVLFSSFLTSCSLFSPAVFSSILSSCSLFFLNQLYSRPSWPIERCLFLTSCILLVLDHILCSFFFLDQLYSLPSWPAEFTVVSHQRIHISDYQLKRCWYIIYVLWTLMAIVSVRYVPSYPKSSFMQWTTRKIGQEGTASS